MRSTKRCSDELYGFIVFFERVVLHDIQRHLLLARLVVPAVNDRVLLVFEILDRREVAVVVVLLLLGGGAHVPALAC